jgi:hypothetical protein
MRGSSPRTTQNAVSPAIASLGGIESFREGGDRL